MLISAHDYSNQSYTYPAASVATAWLLAFNVQKLASSAQVTATGGTYV